MEMYLHLVQVLEPHQYEDWVSLVQDIQALNHVIDYYHPSYLDN